MVTHIMMKPSLTRFLHKLVLALLNPGTTFLLTVTLTEAKNDIKNVRKERRILRNTAVSPKKSNASTKHLLSPFPFSELPEFSYKQK